MAMGTSPRRGLVLPTHRPCFPQIVSYRDRISTIPTYGSGTVLVRNRMQQGRDSSTPLYYPTPTSTSTSSSDQTSAPLQQARMPQEDEYNSTGDSDYQPIKPLAVINLFEHAYLARKQGENGALDVWGKEQWVRDWFKLVDWAQVKGRAS
jgi:Fe-Mn family superoxide dismutase